MKKLGHWIVRKLGKGLAKAEAGFTLIEMLIVIALIGMIAAFVGTNVIRKYNQSQVDGTKIIMRNIGITLDDFRRVCNFYPTTEQGLDALVKPPQGRICKNYDSEGFIKGGKVPKDAWGNDFLYVSDGNKYTITSLGQDGAPGGEGFNKDITSDDL